MKLWNAPARPRRPNRRWRSIRCRWRDRSVEASTLGVKASSAMTRLRASGHRTADRVDETARQSAKIDEFRGGVAIEPVRNSRLVDILYTSTDPEFAADRRQTAWRRPTSQQSMEFRFSESKDAADWLSERLTEQRKALEASEAALQAYRERTARCR